MGLDLGKLMRFSGLWMFLWLACIGSPLWAQDAPDCEATLAVWQVQGAGERAQCYRKRVTIRGVVTIIAANKSRFFLQSPTAESDGLSETSDGILVQTTPIRPLAELAVGDLVEVRGRVNEFYGLTQLEIAGSNSIETLDRRRELPAAIDLAQVSLEWPAGANHPLERYEGMRVHLRDRRVVAPTNYFDEFGVSITGSPAYREMGIEVDDRPDLAGQGWPQWDLNAELLEVDPPELGRPVLQLPVGVPVNVTGAIAYSYLDYQIWPDAVEFDESAIFAYHGRPVRPREAGEFTIATQNVNNLFDTVDDADREDGRDEDYVPEDEAAYRLRLQKTVHQVHEVLGAPDIVALQEVENAAVLFDLVLLLQEADPNLKYYPCLLEGLERRGIDNAFLLRVDRVKNPECFRLPGSYEATYLGPRDLFTRPPLVLEAELWDGQRSQPITLINVHLRSLSDADTQRVMTKRLEQAIMIAEYVQERQTTQPEGLLAVLGDFNAFQFSDGLVDVVGIIAGTQDAKEAQMAPVRDLVEPDLLNQAGLLDPAERYSYVWNGNRQLLDHILTSSQLSALVTDRALGRGNADVPRVWLTEDHGAALAASDHDGMVIYLRLGEG
ncbi:MAG: hypothetical protein OXF22_03935 [Anaerolineaceae bacterium]|nr:hypothetical protein [Anaerolineaceae bacterium]